MFADFGIVLGGAAAILVLAEIVIRQTLRLARHYGFSGTFAGLTILSIGTSLLEIMTHVIGSIHIVMEPWTMDTMSGLLIGSNITNPLFGAGLGAMISTYTVPAVVIWHDLPVKIATGALLYAFLLKHERPSRAALLVLLVTYFVYLLLRPLLFPRDA